MPTQQDYYNYLRSQATSPKPFVGSSREQVKKDEGFNLGQGIIDLLSVGTYATAGLAKKLGDNVSAIQRGDLGAVLDIANPISSLGAIGEGISKRQTYAPLLENLGVDKNASPWLGLALDIGLDPLTYLSFGSVAAIKGVAGGGRLAMLANKTGGKIAPKAAAGSKVAETTADLIIPTGRELTQAEKLGNLLTGVTRGYESKKAEIRLTHFGSKLERGVAKKIAKSGDQALEDITFAPMITRGATGAAKDAAYRGLLTADNAARGIIQESRRLTRLAGKAGKASEKLTEKGIVDPKVAVKAEKKRKKAEAAGVAATAAADVANAVEEVAAPAAGGTKQLSAKALMSLMSDEQKAAANFKRLQGQVAKLDQIARNIEDPRQASPNYISDLRPAVYDTSSPYSPVNLVPAVKASKGGFVANAISKDPKYKADQIKSKVVYDTEEEALAAAKTFIDDRLAAPLAELEAEVTKRIDEVIAYEDGVAIAEALSGIKGLDKKDIVASFVRAMGLGENPTKKDLAVYNALQDVVVKLPTDAEYDGLRVAVNQLNRDRLKAARSAVEKLPMNKEKWTAEEQAIYRNYVNSIPAVQRTELEAWANFINSLPGVQKQIANNRKGVSPVRWFDNGEYNPFYRIYQTGPIEPNDYYQLGDLVYEMSYAEKVANLRKQENLASKGKKSMSGEEADVNPAAVEDAAGEKLKPAKEVSLFSQQVAKLSKTNKTKFEKLQKQAADTRKNLRVFKQKGYDLGLQRNVDIEDRLPTKSEYEEVVKFYEDEIVRLTDEMAVFVPAIKQELPPSLKPGAKEEPVLVREVTEDAVPVGTNRKRLEQSISGAKATDATMRDLVLLASYMKQTEAAGVKQVLAKTLAALPAKISDVKPLEKVSLLGRVFPKGSDKDNQIFAQFKKYLSEQIEGDRKNLADELNSDPELLKEVFQEFLSGRNIERAIVDGAVDMEKLVLPETVGFTGLADLIDALKKNEVTLSPIEETRIKQAVGITDQRATVDNEKLIKSLVSLTRRYQEAERQAAVTATAVTLATQTRNFIATDGAAATTENAISASGTPVADEIALAVETATQITEEVTKTVDDVVGGTATAAPVEELIARQSEIQTRAAQDFLAGMEELRAMGSSAEFIAPMINNIFLKAAEKKGAQASGVVAKMQKIATARGITVEDLIDTVVTGENYTARENIDDFFSGVDIRLDALNTEARFNLFNEATAKVRFLSGKKQDGTLRRPDATPESLLREENLLIGTIESYFRSMGVAVVAGENYGEVLLRHGVAKTDDALPEGATDIKSFATYADIVKVALDKGQADLINRLRAPKPPKGGNVQNVMPSQFEKAWLVILDALSKNEKITTGDATWLRAKQAFNTVYSPTRADGVKSQPVEDLFKPAPHVIGSKATIKGKTVEFRASKDVQAAADEFIDWLVANGEDVLAIHAGRAADAYGPHSLEILKRSQEIYTTMIKLAVAREGLIANSARLAEAGEVQVEVGGKLVSRPALAVGDEATAGFDKLVELLTPIIKEVKKNVSPEDIVNSGIFDTLMGTTLKVVSQKANTASGKYAVTQIYKEAVEAAERVLRFEEAYPVAKTPTKKQTKAETAKIRKERQAKTAETAENAARAAEDADAIRVEDEAIQTTKTQKGEKPAFEKSESRTNLVAGHEDPYVAMLEMTANTMFKSRIEDWWMSRFSGTFGIGKELKTGLTGIEHLDISHIGRFRRGLEKISRRFNNDMVTINGAFKLMQQWGSEMRALDLEGEPLTSFDEWVKTADTAGVNMDAVEALKPWHEQLFGSLDGKADGVLSKAMELATFRNELNRAIGRQGLADVNKNGEGFILRKISEESGENAHPLDVRWSWTKVDVDEFVNINALEFLARYSTALLTAHTRLASVETFTYFFGRSLKQIRDEGLDPSNFYKPDPAEVNGIGHLIPEDVYFEPAEFEKLIWLNKYLDADNGFGSASLQRMVDISDRITHVLKASHTLWRPGHHVTSIVGESFINMIHGVTSPAYYSKGWNLMRKFSPNSVDDSQDVFRSLAELNAGKGMVVKADQFDNYFYINSDGTKRVVNEKAVWAMMERYGVATNPFQSKEDFILTDGSKFGTGLFKSVARQNDKLATFSAHRDNIFRISHFIKELERGGQYGSLELAAIAAARKVHEAHPTVGSLSAFEKKYMRRVVFFYTWQRLMATHIAKLMLEQPGIVTIPSKIQYAIGQANGFEPTSFGDPWDPDGMYASYNTGSVYGPQFAGPQGANDAWGIQPAVPQLDILNTLFQGFSVQPNQPVTEAFGNGLLNLATKNFSPIPKMFAEISTQQKVGTTGGPIAPQGNYLPYFLDQIGGVNTLSQITGLGRDPVTNKTQENFDEERIRKIANWLTGQKLTDYSTPASQKQWTQDQRDTIARLIKQQNPTQSTVQY